MGCYGDSLAVSPNIDQLANSGVVFNRAYVQQAVCNPSRASMLTGLRPDQIGVVDLRAHIRSKMPDVVTLPQLFKNNNYESAGLGKIFHGHKRSQDDISWSVEAKFNVLSTKDRYVLSKNQINGKAAATEFAEVHDTLYADGKITEEAIRMLRIFKNNKTPLFLALGYRKPHLPFAAPNKYWELYERDSFSPYRDRDKPENAPEIAFHDWQELRGYTDIPDAGPLTVEKEKELWHGYYSCVSYIDAQIGRVLKELDELGLTDSTIIVFLSDHGFHLGEQNLWCKSTNFELDVRTPLIISAPGISQSGTISNAIVEIVDLYPTIIDLCDINPEGILSGVSLKPVLIDPEKKWNKPAFSQFTRPYRAVHNIDNATHMGYSIRTDKWRYTAWYNLKNDSIEFRELYLLSSLNYETVNVSGYKEFAEVEMDHHKLVQNYKEGKY